MTRPRERHFAPGGVDHRIKNRDEHAAQVAAEGAVHFRQGLRRRLKARRNLTQLQSLCGQDCAATRTLANAIAKGPNVRVVTAAVIEPQPAVTTN